jgi:hypothetical protein
LTFSPLHGAFGVAGWDWAALKLRIGRVAFVWHFSQAGLAKSEWCEVRQKNSGQKNRKQALVSAQTVVKLFVRRVSNLILDCGRSPRQIIRRLTTPI